MVKYGPFAWAEAALSDKEGQRLHDQVQQQLDDI
jgi:hypothetical protein